jgi:mannose-6-phosphate isomerase-like protein (cupin superfamily)
MKLPALILRLDRTKDDPALRPGGRGARKLIVTELRENAESLPRHADWASSDAAGKCPVLVMPSTELAVFNETAPQDRHYHRKATEIYFVLEGQLLIEIEHVDHLLYGGDAIVVLPGAVHHIKPSGHRFLCRVISIDCAGPADKFVVSP